MEWNCGSGRLHDTVFHCVVEDWHEEMIILADRGFHANAGNPDNLKICAKGTWNERMLIETVFSLFTTVLHLKKLTQRERWALHTRLAYVMAAFNLCTAWTGKVKLELAPFAL